MEKELSSQIERLRKALEEADAILVGAGSGLSTSAGFEYSGKRFEENLGDFGERYGFHDMYSGGFYPFETEEEKWAYWSRFVFLNRYVDPPKDTYKLLLDLIGEKDHFVLTTNVDHCFQKAGFKKERLFYTQGDYGLFQCSEPCHRKTYNNEDAIRKMVSEQKDMKVPTELLPRCPVCGKPMSMNLRTDSTFVEDEGWEKATERYALFLDAHRHGKVVYLELGVGFNTPVIIKYPFWRYVYQNPDATYVCIDKGRIIVPDEIADRTIGINEDIDAVLRALADNDSLDIQVKKPTTVKPGRRDFLRK